MGTAELNPNGSFNYAHQYPGVIFGTVPSGQWHDALSDDDNTTGVRFETDYISANWKQFYIQYSVPDPDLPDTARIDWIRVDFRERHATNAGFIIPHTLQAFVIGENYSRTVYRDLGFVGRAPINPGDGVTSSITTTGTNEGIPWSQCFYFTVLWGSYIDFVLEFPWNSSNYPYITETWLTVGYTLQPTVITISPSTTTEDPRPEITWAVGNVEEKGPSAHQVIVLPAGSTDANSNAIGDSDFDPTTGSGVAYNSGKTFSPSTVKQIPNVLAPGVWHVYIKQWVGSGVDEYASEWGHEDFTLEAATVDAPTIALTTHTASNTVLVTINPGSPVEDLVAETIEVQYYDPVTATWIAAPIANSMVNGTGTSVFYDGLHAPGESVSYRARGIATFDGAEFASAWTQASTHTVATTEEWWLRSSSDYTLNVSLNEIDGLLMREAKQTRQKPNTTAWGIGAREAVMAHDVTKGDVHDCSIWAFTMASYTALRALLEDGDDLILVNPWGELWRVQVGGQVDEEVIKAAPSAGETTPLGFVRVVNVQFVEVVTP